MKLPKLFQGLLLAAMVVTLSGCRIEWTETPAPTPTLTATATATLTPTPTDTPTPAPTETPTPTITPVATQSISSIANALMPVTQGIGVPEASAYDPKKMGIHPIILITVEEQNDWNKSLPDSWRSSYVSQTELVAVLRLNRVMIQWIDYELPHLGRVFLGRYRSDAEIWMREAQTGKLIAHTVFEGPVPPPLPKYNKIKAVRDVIGPPVSSEVIQLWLKEFVEK